MISYTFHYYFVVHKQLQQQLRETVLDLEQLRITQQTTEAAAEAKMSSRASGIFICLTKLFLLLVLSS